MPNPAISAAEAKSKGLCEKCKAKPLHTMHYCEDCMKAIREKKRLNLLKRGVKASS